MAETVKVNGRRLAELRRRRFWSQRELARRAGVNHQTVMRHETENENENETENMKPYMGPRSPARMSTVRKLAEALGVPGTDFAEITGARREPPREKGVS